MIYNKAKELIKETAIYKSLPPFEECLKIECKLRGGQAPFHEMRGVKLRGWIGGNGSGKTCMLRDELKKLREALRVE